MDEIDSKVLRILAEDARLSWADLGAALGLSAPAAAERVRRLEERGIIRGFEARIDARAVGYGMTAFVAVTVGSAAARAAFVKQIERMPEVLECHHIAGEDDYLVKVRCKDTQDLERVLTDELRAHSGGVRTRTTVVLSTLKEEAGPPLEKRR